MEYRYFVQLAFNGAAYSGWQVQPNAVTVQQWIERGLSVIAGAKEGVTGCGRTDAGVHARVFYAHFDCPNTFTSDELGQLAFKLNRFLPPDIAIFKIIPVLPGAHARFSAQWREYEYLILRKKDPFSSNLAYFVHGNLDIGRMNDCASLLLGRNDFQCFSKANTQVNNYYCDVQRAEWVEQGDSLKLTIRADRFLRNMVRAIVGTLLDAGRGKISPAEFQLIIDSHNRCKAGFSVPAKGLTLTDIGYPDEIFQENPVSFLSLTDEKIISHYYTDSRFDESDGHEPVS